MRYDKLDRFEKNELLNKWHKEAKAILKEENTELAGNALKYFLKGYIAERKEHLAAGMETYNDGYYNDILKKKLPELERLQPLRTRRIETGWKDIPFLININGQSFGYATKAEMDADYRRVTADFVQHIDAE